MCTTTIALVFSVISSSILLGSIFKVSLMLAHKGVAPDSTIASTVATKVKAWVITSSPLPMPNAANAILSAAVLEVTANE